MQQIIFLHTNDIHGDVFYFARLATYIRQIEAENPHANIIILDAGDSQDQDQPLSHATRGVIMHQLLQEVGCMVTVLGNKAMKKWGMSIVEDYGRHLPVLLANLRMPDKSLVPGTQPYALLDIDGLRFGVIGISANDAKYVSYHDLCVLDTHDTIQHYRQHLYEEEGVDEVILLSHMGWARDYALARLSWFDLPLIIGGHSHTLRMHGDMVDGTMVVQAGSYARYLGRVDAYFDDHLHIHHAQVIPIRPMTEPDPALLSVIKQAQSQINVQE